MLTRDIYRDFYQDVATGPSFEEKLFLAGKRIVIIFSGCALTLGMLDIAGIHSFSGASEAFRAAPSALASFGETVRSGIGGISISKPSIDDAIRVAIPNKTFVRFSSAKEPSVVDDLAAVNKRDAVSLAMTSAEPVMRDIKAASPEELKAVAAPKTAAAPAEKLKPQPLKETVAPAVPVDMIKQPAPKTAAVAADTLKIDVAPKAANAMAAEEVRLASLSLPAANPDFNNAPVTSPIIAPAPAPSASLALPETAPSLASLTPAEPASAMTAPDETPSPTLESSVGLIPLSKVPLPRAAPPISPADRLGLRGTEYAKAERCLANAIYFEARSEPIRGQMAVAQVVLNRVFSPFYPKDVCSVVYQNANRHLACQFTFACDGKSKAINERGAWASANRIARQTLDGQLYVPEVGKSTHYHAAYVRPNWVREMHRLVSFGIHSFYRPWAWGNGSDQPSWGTAAMAAQLKTKTASVTR